MARHNSARTAKVSVDTATSRADGVLRSSAVDSPREGQVIAYARERIEGGLKGASRYDRARRGIITALRNTATTLGVAGGIAACASGEEPQNTDPVDAGTPPPVRADVADAAIPPLPDVVMPDAGDAGTTHPDAEAVHPDAEPGHDADGGTDAGPDPMPDPPTLPRNRIEIGPNDTNFPLEVNVGANTTALTFVPPGGTEPFTVKDVTPGSAMTLTLPPPGMPSMPLDGQWSVSSCNGAGAARCNTAGSVPFNVERYALPSAPTVDQSEVALGPNLPERQVNLTVTDPATTEIRVTKDSIPMPAIPVVPGQTNYPFTVRMSDGAGTYEFRSACHNGRAVSAAAATVNVREDNEAPPEPEITTGGGIGLDPGGTNYTVEGITLGADTETMQVLDTQYDINGQPIPGATWQNVPNYQVGSDNWTFNGQLGGAFETHRLRFRAIDRANNVGNETNNFEIEWAGG